MWGPTVAAVSIVLDHAEDMSTVRQALEGLLQAAKLGAYHHVDEVGVPCVCFQTAVGCTVLLRSVLLRSVLLNLVWLSLVLLRLVLLRLVLLRLMLLRLVLLRSVLLRSVLLNLVWLSLVLLRLVLLTLVVLRLMLIGVAQLVLLRACRTACRKMALLIWCWSKSVAHIWWSSNVVVQVDFGHFQVMDLLVVSLSEFTSPMNPFSVHLLLALCGIHLLLALSGIHLLLAASNQSLVCSGDGLAGGVPQQVHIPLATFFGVYLLFALCGVHLLLALSGIHLLLVASNQSLVCSGGGFAGDVPQQVHISPEPFWRTSSSCSSGIHLLLASPNQSLVHLGDGLAGRIPQQVHLPLESLGLQASGGLWRE